MLAAEASESGRQLPHPGTTAEASEWQFAKRAQISSAVPEATCGMCCRLREINWRPGAQRRATGFRTCPSSPRPGQCTAIEERYGRRAGRGDPERTHGPEDRDRGYP